MATRKKISDQPPTEPAASGEEASRVARAAEAGTPTAEGVLADTQAVVREALKNGDHRTALKGLEMLGKHFGLFGERTEAETAASGQVLIYKLPDNGRDQSPSVKKLPDNGRDQSQAEKKSDAGRDA